MFETALDGFDSVLFNSFFVKRTETAKQLIWHINDESRLWTWCKVMEEKKTNSFTRESHLEGTLS